MSSVPASMLLVLNRLLPPPGMHYMSRLVLGIPRHGAMRDGAWPLTGVQHAMVLAAKVIPRPLMQRLTERAARRAVAREASEQGSEKDV
jgi:hypothetical protein